MANQETAARHGLPPAIPGSATQRPRVVVVMPAYNAARTLQMTYMELPRDKVDMVILVDDGSKDDTVEIARNLNLKLFVHGRNYGYGANQKTCYAEALQAGADVVVMVHPDYQYDPRLLPELLEPLTGGHADVVLGSRLKSGSALRDGMPWWKYIANRSLTAVENGVFGLDLSEYHTGYRAFSRAVLERLDLEANSDDFVFDNQMLAQILWHGFTIAEVSCPTKYFPEASSINLRRSIHYGFGCLSTGLRFRLARMGLAESRLFPEPAA